MGWLVLIGDGLVGRWAGWEMDLLEEGLAGRWIDLEVDFLGDGLAWRWIVFVVDWLGGGLIRTNRGWVGLELGDALGKCLFAKGIGSEISWFGINIGWEMSRLEMGRFRDGLSMGLCVCVNPCGYTCSCYSVTAACYLWS